MPGLVPGICGDPTDPAAVCGKDVDGRDKPSQDDKRPRVVIPGQLRDIER